MSTGIVITDAMVEAYLTAQRKSVENAACWTRPQKGGPHTLDIACRAGLAAALAATGTPQVPAAAVDLVNALLLEAEKFWWNDGPERKSAEPMNAAKRAVLEALASQGAAPASATTADELAEAVKALDTALSPVWRAADARARYAAICKMERLQSLVASIREQAGAAPTGAGDADLSQIEIAGLTSSVGHLSALLDVQSELLARAMAAMKALEESAAPADESRGDFDCLIPEEKWATFVDTRATLLHDVARSPVAAPQQPAEAAPGEIDALRANDARYRWLRERERWASVQIDFERGGTYRQHRVCWYDGNGWPQVAGQSLDAAIDAALANNKKGGEQ